MQHEIRYADLEAYAYNGYTFIPGTARTLAGEEWVSVDGYEPVFVQRSLVEIGEELHMTVAMVRKHIERANRKLK